RIVAVGAPGLVVQHGIVALGGGPLVLSMGRDREVLRIGPALVGSVRKNRAALLDGVYEAAARSAGGPPQPFAAHPRVPVRAGRDGFRQANGRSRVVLNAEKKAGAVAGLRLSQIAGG